MKRMVSAIAAACVCAAAIAGCSSDKKEASGNSLPSGSTSSEADVIFDKADRVVTDDSDIFKGGKMLGGTVVDYLTKEIWGGEADWDCLGQLRDNGMNWVRVGVMRKSSALLAETPVEKWNTVAQTGWSSLEFAEEILRDATENGFRKNLFFFLSTENAYYGYQPLPADWKTLTPEQLCTEVEKYCYETTKYFMDKKLDINLYDIGNEIQNGILGHYVGQGGLSAPVDTYTDNEWMRENVWKTEATLLKACIRGVKRANPDAKINLHGAGFGYDSNNTLLRNFYQAMVDFGVPFDVAGISYYWQEIHMREGGGHPQEAYFKTEECLDFIKFLTDDLGKKFIFSEYVYQYDCPDTITVQPNVGYPLTLQGQRDWIRDFLKFVVETPEVSGCLYFYPEYYPTFQMDARYKSLNSAGLFTNSLRPNPALKEFNQYKKP